MDNPLDGRHGRPGTVRHPHCGGQGNARPRGVRGDSAENRTERGRPIPIRRCETMPTPGVAPREDARHADIRRRALDPAREPLPTRVEDVPELPSGGCPRPRRRAGRARPRAPPTAPGWRHRRPCPPAPGLDVGDQPDRDPRPRSRRDRPRRRQPRRRSPLLVARGIDRFLDLGSGGGYPGSAARRWRCPQSGPCWSNRSPRRPASSRPSSPPPVSTARSRRPRSGPRPWPPIRATAGAGRPSPPGPSRRCAELVELAFPLLAPGGSSSPGSAATSPTRWRPRSGRSTRSAVARSRASRCDVAGLDGHVLVVVTRRGHVPAAYPRDPEARRADRGDRAVDRATPLLP